MQTVAITGANGFTGRYLSKLLVERGYAVHGLVQNPHGVSNTENAILHRCDLTDLGKIKKTLSAIQPNKIVHLAAVSFVPVDDVETIYRTNIIGTRNLLQAASDENLSIDSILLASSANIYGNGADKILTEQTPPAPVNDYGVSKQAMESIGRIFSDRLPIIVTRPFNYTGVGQSLNFLIPKIVDHIRRRAPVIELGNVDVARDFSDVRVVTQIYAGLLEEQEAIGKTINICSGRAYSLLDILKMAKAISGHEIGVKVNPLFIRDHEVKTLIGSRTCLESLLPGLPSLGLEQTLRWMIEAPN